MFLFFSSLCSEAKLKRLQEDPSSPVFQQELYQLIKDQAAAVDDADAEYDAAENGEFELEDEVSKIQKRFKKIIFFLFFFFFFFFVCFFYRFFT